MKGRLLSVEEVNKLKTGDKVYIIPKVRRCNHKDNVGLAMVKRSVGNTIKFYPAQGKDKKPFTTYNYTSAAPKSFLEVYEWIEQEEYITQDNNKILLGRKLTVEDLEKMHNKKIFIKCSNKSCEGIAYVDSKKRITKEKINSVVCLWGFDTIREGISGFGSTVEAYEIIEEGENNMNNKQLLKSDLKTGMWIENRSGKKGMVLLNTSHGDVISGKDLWCPLNNYNEKLEGEIGKHFDVIKVYQPKNNKSYYNMQANECQLVWEREESPKNIAPKDTEFTYTYNFEPISVKIKGKRIMVVDAFSNKGFANCHPDDVFNQNIGIEIAYWDMKRRIAENKIKKYKN